MLNILNSYSIDSYSCCGSLLFPLINDCVGVITLQLTNISLSCCCRTSSNFEEVLSDVMTIKHLCWYAGPLMMHQIKERNISARAYSYFALNCFMLLFLFLGPSVLFVPVKAPQ